ncbi:Cleavage and polyadenylation specificity factor subunit 5 [Chondrus crispus]|uniref:Cleavage and polyadenylation specificity factor subunit 5 n=1 Tax=Chondrus crispus TaxID=2769 RepID=R7QCN0_CHOCR|nr:Cleavage and polyadenylation specificity factor subunit 5 [Chondrus crispus]CDF35503.1 Cleavage and polyadenylation specificity factor subunit 5 [Chondrus crispus]|eukprot:XP_005715322.1 Cleavage and polyadenylation specificity factor subunit 5 [Chondrus crispus]
MIGEMQSQSAPGTDAMKSELDTAMTGSAEGGDAKTVPPGATYYEDRPGAKGKLDHEKSDGAEEVGKPRVAKADSDIANHVSKLQQQTAKSQSIVGTEPPDELSIAQKSGADTTIDKNDEKNDKKAPANDTGGAEDRTDGPQPEHTLEVKEGSEDDQLNGPTGTDSDEDPFAGLNELASMDIYDLSNYTFGKKNQESKSKVMQLMPRAEMAKVLEKNYEERGMRRSVGGVILVHSHNFPHILLLQRSDGKGEYALPGGKLRPGESDEEGLQRKLNTKLKPEGQADTDEEQELDVGERICNWYATDFHRRYYPYVPAHVTKVKEELHVYIVLLPNKFMFSVPKNLQLVAVPLFELFKNSATYGDVISAIPPLLSRWHINYC